MEMIALACLFSGCAYMNGDAMWLSRHQKESKRYNRLSTFGDVEYSFHDDRLPFCFIVDGCSEFGHIGRSMGAPDLSEGGYVGIDSVLRFTVKTTNPDVGVEFLVSNGVLQVVCAPGPHGWKVERRTGPLSKDTALIDMNEQWREQAQGRSISVGVWSHGCSIRIHRLGSYGVVYNYSFPENEGGYASLCILQIENLRWCHYARLS